MRPFTRRQWSYAVLIGLIVFLLGSLYHELHVKDRAIASLTQSNQTVVDKLAEILGHVITTETAAIEAGQTPTVRIEDVLAQIKGVDQTIIDQALQKAYKQVGRGATGPQGPPGPAGPAASSTTTTRPAGSTTSTPPAPATTTTSATTTTTRPAATTTTTRPCTLRLLGACLLR